MNYEITHAHLERNEEKRLIGQIIFTLEGHPDPYEMTLLSKNGREWDYSLNFAAASGSEELFMQADQLLEEDDELFDALIDAVKATLVEA